jgi:hypothetical protein
MQQPPARIRYGDIVVARTIVSPALFKKIEEARMGGPMTIRQDVPFQVTQRQERYVAPKKVLKDVNIQQPRATSDPVWIRDSDDLGIGLAPYSYEKRVEAAGIWQEGFQERIGRTEQFFTDLIRRSPFRGTDRPLGFWEEVGAGGLAAPAIIPLGLAEALPLSAYKAGLAIEGLFYPETRKEVVREAGRAFFETPKTLATSFDPRTPTGVVGISTIVAAPSYIGGLIKGARGAYIKVGATKVPPEEVFAKTVLEGKEKLPTAKSIPEVQKRFEATRTPEGKIEVATAAPEPLKTTVAGIGKKAGLGLEDPGIYVTPKGETSPYFLRTKPMPEAQYSISFNPFAQARVPTITEFEALGVVRLPREVITQPGFEPVLKYQETTLAGTARVQITKRSEIGLGAVERQRFREPVKGRLIKEPRTSEIEAVVPVGQQFRYVPKTFYGRVKGFELYTEFEGTPVAIRRAELIESKALTRTRGRRVTEKDIRAGAKAVSELATSKTVYPYSAPGSTFYPSASSLPGASSGGGSVSYPSPSSVISEPSSYVSGVTSSRPGASYPTTPSYPVTPSRPSYPSRPTYPSRVVYPSRPSYPLRPGRPSYPGRPSRTVYPGRPGEPRRPTTPIYKLPGTRKASRVLGGFTAEVRRRGKFKSIGAFTNIMKAAARGRKRVETTAAATYRVRDPYGRVVKVGAPSESFYVKPTGEVIERRERRIKSLGELREITYEGIRASAAKRRGYL